MAFQNFHSVPHGDKWAVIQEGNEEPLHIKDTQAEAEALAKDYARELKGEAKLHGKDGKIKDSDSYGNDPHPPIDKKH
jgi:hypothetical protein